MNARKKTKDDNLKDDQLVVSLRTLANMLDAHRSSVRRWLQEAGIRPVVLGRGRKGAIRYHWSDVKEWLDSLRGVD
jgi:hypothetical protein